MGWEAFDALFASGYEVVGSHWLLTSLPSSQLGIPQSERN